VLKFVHRHELLGIFCPACCPVENAWLLNSLANEEVRALRLRQHDVICHLEVLDEGVPVFPIDGHPDLLASKGHFSGGQ
jgi:hypothetical protein